MKKTALAIAWGLGWLSASAWSDDSKVEYKPMAIGALQEMGMIHKGIYSIGSANPAEVVESDWVDHFGAFMTKEAIINERLHLTGGLGGIFQFRKPELPAGVVNAGFSGAQRKGFFIGPTDAQAIYYLGGEPDNPFAKIGAGMFMYKYNPQAYNLGEYLFRSGPYPTFTTTGGYLIVNGAAANLQGLRTNLNLGALKADFFLTTETALAPLYDWSLASVATYTFRDGLLELGAGVNFKRLIQVRPSRTAKETANNGYFTYKGVVYAGNPANYSLPVSYYQNRVKDFGLASDSAKLAAATALQANFQAALDDTTTTLKYNYFSAAGTLLMARICVDPKKVMGSEIFGSEDLKLYGEVGLLGVKNYPIFYKKQSERMPIMAGFNIPTFKLLDLFAVQTEYMNSPHLNNTSQITKGGEFGGTWNTPALPLASDKISSKTDYLDLAKRDNFKWSVLLKKAIGTNITFSGQVASDHMRLTSSYFYYGPQFDHNEVTADKDNWYWMTQISWGI